MKPTLQSPITDEVRTSLEQSNPLSPATPTPFPVDNATIQTAKKDREAAVAAEDTFTLDGGLRVGGYLGRMWRQDSPVDGLMARLAVNKELLPDPNYVPYDPAEWKELTAGVPEEFHKEFYKAHSAAHGRFLRERLLQKNDELTNLDDLGIAGNVGRLAFGFVEPTTLAAALIARPVTGLVKGAQLSVGVARSGLRAARAVEGANRAAALEKATGNLAAAAEHEGSKLAIASGIAAGGAGGAAFEAVRQNVNHEDSPLGVLEAALFTMGLSAPFAGLSARHMNRLTEVAAKDHQALKAARKALDGEHLTPAEEKHLVDAEQRLKRIYSVETGKVDATDDPTRVIYVDSKGRASVGKKGDSVLYVDSKGNVSGEHPTLEPAIDTDADFLQSLRHELRQKADSIRAELFPNRGQPVPKGPSEVERAMQAGRAQRETAAIEARKRGETVIDAPAAPRTADAPLETQMEVAMRKVTEARGKQAESRKRHADFDAALREVEARKSKELDDLWAQGHLSKAEADEAKAELSRERAAAGITEKREVHRADREVVEAEKATATEAPAEHTEADPIGSEVIYRDEHGRPDEGVVVQVNSKGTLKVDMYPDMSPEFRPSSGSRYKWVKREDLDPDSPLYRDPGELEGFLPGSVGSAQTAHISSDPGQGTTYAAKARLDIFAQLNKSTNSVLRQFGNWLVKDPIQTDAYVAQGWTASERKSHIQRVVVGAFHREARDAWQDAVKKRKLSLWKQFSAHKEFYEDVSRVARGDADVLINNPDIAPELQKAAGAMRKVFDTLGDRAMQAGVQGAENLKLGGQYVNRSWNHNNIRAAMKRFGEGNVYQLLADAIRVPGLTGDVAKAKTFLTAVRKLEFNHVLPDLQLIGHDMVALRKELDAAGLSPSQIDAIVDVMFDQKKSTADAGNPTNLRFRFDIDENHSAAINGETLRVSDLFENDSRVLADKYANSIGGHIAIAETSGLKSRAEFMRELAKADEEHLNGASLSQDADGFNREKQVVLDMYDYVTGRPMSVQTFNRLDRFVNTFRAYTRSLFLGQLGVAAASEMSNAIGMGTFRAFAAQSPNFMHAIRSFRTGRIANKELALDIEAMVGSGNELAASHARQHEVTEFTYDRGITQFEDFANKASHAVDVLSGNRNITASTRQATAAIMVQKHVNMANGKMKLTPKLRERLVGQGIDDDAIDDVLHDLAAHTQVDRSGRVEEIKWENWQQASPKTYDTYQLALMREVRDAIQDHDIGETFMWSHRTLGKLVTELRQFLFVSHAKQSLKNLRYRDLQAFNTFAFTFVGQMLSYSAQTAANFAHNPDELQRRLSDDRIVKAALQRMSIMGIMPAIFDTGHVALTGKSFFQGGTANTDNRNLLITPSYMAASRLIGGLTTVGNAVNPFADTTTTRKEAQDLFGILPGSNTWLMRNLNDAVSSSFPKNEPREQ